MRRTGSATGDPPAAAESYHELELRFILLIYLSVGYMIIGLYTGTVPGTGIIYYMKGGNPKWRIWDDVVTYCDLESLLKYTYINNMAKYLNTVLI